MSRPRPLEIRALVPLLEQDWETPEVLAQALIEALDKARMDRTSFIVVIQVGRGDKVFYCGMGPYPGKASALAALKRRGVQSNYERWAIVPISSPEGFDDLLERTG